MDFYELSSLLRESMERRCNQYFMAVLWYKVEGEDVLGNFICIHYTSWNIHDDAEREGESEKHSESSPPPHCVTSANKLTATKTSSSNPKMLLISDLDVVV